MTEDVEMSKKVDLWGYCRKTVQPWWDESALDIFRKDAVEKRECIRYTYGILVTKKPACGASHDWNAAMSAMSAGMDGFEKAFWTFYRDKTEANAELFSDAYGEMCPAYMMAKDAIFNSELRGRGRIRREPCLGRRARGTFRPFRTCRSTWTPRGSLCPFPIRGTSRTAPFCAFCSRRIRLSCPEALERPFSRLF